MRNMSSNDVDNKKPNFKKTLNLPKTSFPMKANLAQNEPASLKRWTAAGQYDRALAARADAPRYIFHDGPPYANGHIHIGHLMNKVLKDFVVRSQLMDGKHCAFVPGWDCHGLPIEHKVMTELHEKGKAAAIAALDEDNRRMAVRRACRSYAEKFVKLQRGELERLLTLADYDNPYLTMDSTYEGATLDVFAVLLEKGLVFRDLKPIHWSLENKTALAEAELEYEDREDPSIDVEFEAADRDAVGKAFGIELDQTPSFMIWTTTPWTLPANLAIAVHERYTYALARVDGSLTVVAKDLLDRVTSRAGAESVEVLAQAPGAALLGLRYKHPFCDRDGAIVSADYVTLEDGTGLVHTAPGHGADDYRTGLREGLPVYCPVLEDGVYDDTVPQWLHGKSIWDANNVIIEHLRDSGHLVHVEMITHSYPHDWRGGSPVIFRATEQWFIGVDRPFDDGESLRARALASVANEFDFIPAWGQNRMRGMLDSRPDWCLSRQRAWGLPIPSFVMESGTPFMTAASVRAIAKRVRESGSDVWYTESPEELLRDYDAASDPDAPVDLKIASLQKMQDIFDVWFESGSSWNAVVRERDLGWPIDLYSEGSDQHRGWFQASLLPAIGVTGAAPYRKLLTHGFMVDKNGKKMSKSGGNALDVADLLKHYGADVCRWWVSSLAYENDVKVDMDYFKVAGESYRKVRNTLRFLLSNLADFDGAHDAEEVTVPAASIDGWALAKTAEVQARVRDAYARLNWREAHLALYDFCNDTVSAVYCAAVKDRLYCDAPEAPRRRQTQRTMAQIIDCLCRLLAPIMPHTAEEAHAALHGDGAGFIAETFIDFDCETDDRFTTLLTLRERALKALEESKASGIDNPLDAGVVVSHAEAATLAAFADDFADLCGVSRARFVEGDAPIVVEDLRESPRCERSWKRDETVRERSDGSVLSDRDAAVLDL